MILDPQTPKRVDHAIHPLGHNALLAGLVFTYYIPHIYKMYLCTYMGIPDVDFS